MTEPTLTCPACRTQIKLTESLAAPLIEATRKRLEAQLARKEAEIAGREAAIRDQQAEIAAARDAIDAQVATKVEQERGRIAAAEAQKAKRLVAIDVDEKIKQIADLNDVLRQRDAKLAEALSGISRSSSRSSLSSIASTGPLCGRLNLRPCGERAAAVAAEPYLLPRCLCPTILDR
jgi:hypothetical protein